MLVLFALSGEKTHNALKYMTLDMLLDPQKHHQIRHDMLRPISSSAFNGKLAVMDANKFLDLFSQKYTNDNKDPINEQAKLMDSVLNTYD